MRRPAALALALACASCTEPAAPTADRTTSPDGPAASSTQGARDGGTAGKPRPPFPNMATAAWGTDVVEAAARAADPALLASTSQKGVEAALAELHGMLPGGELRAQRAAAAAWKTATTDAERGLAASLLAAALVLDPNVDGYKDRLTDAHGVQSYAATFEAVPPTGQAARALVAASAGSVDAARKVVELLGPQQAPDGSARLFLALTMRTLGDRGDDVLDTLQQAIVLLPDSLRARATLAETLLELKAGHEALAALPATSRSPWVEALRGRAMVLAGDAKGIDVLRKAQEQLDEGRRGEALFWLGIAVADEPATRAEAPQVSATLAARPGYALEAKVTDALVAQQAGRYQDARALLEVPAKKGNLPTSIASRVLWGLVDACAGTGDLACVESYGGRAESLDGDRARFHFARAAVVLVGKQAPAGVTDAGGAVAVAVTVDVDDALRRAHLLSPFDDGLATRVGVPVVPGGAARASVVRAARAALARRAPKLAAQLLAPTVKDPACRVCRALFAEAAPDADEAGRRAIAAVNGEGPPLEESDLVDVVDLLGGSATKPTAAALAQLASDARPAIAAAVAMAKADQANPAQRSARKTGGHLDDHAAPQLPRSPPGGP